MSIRIITDFTQAYPNVNRTESAGWLIDRVLASPGGTFTGNATLYPRLKQIVKPGVYVVNARTPAELVKLLMRLQARTDLEWVEPTVTYGPTSSPAKPAAPKYDRLVG